MTETNENPPENRPAENEGEQRFFEDWSASWAPLSPEAARRRLEGFVAADGGFCSASGGSTQMAAAVAWALSEIDRLRPDAVKASLRAGTLAALASSKPKKPWGRR